MQRQEYLHLLNPDDSLEGVFEKLGGTLCVYKGNGSYNYNGEPVIGFAWFHSNFECIMELSKTIELDCSFKALAPDVFLCPTDYISKYRLSSRSSCWSEGIK